MGGKEDPFRQYKGLLSAEPMEVAPYQKHAGGQKVYDVDEMKSLMDVLRRVGIYDLATPPEVMRPPINYVLPEPSKLYGTEGITF